MDEKVIETTVKKTTKKDASGIGDDVFQLIVDMTDKLVELKDDNSYKFAELGKSQNLVLCSYLEGYCYQKGLGVKKDLDKAEEIYKKYFDSVKLLADNGDSKAQLYVGFYYIKGLGGVEKDEDEAFDYFAKSRMQGNTRAQNQLFKFAERIGNGKLDRRAQEKAAIWAEKAMEIENQYMALMGEHEEKEINFLKSLETIANKGIAFAQMLLANWYEKGIYTTVNLDKAFTWYQKAAETNKDAMFYLACAYHNGTGTKKDPAKAFEWCFKASEKEVVDAYNMLGDFYYDGVGCEQDYDQSFIWHEKAANAGCIDAKYKLGIHYYNAEGCKKDVKKSLACYEEAASAGYGIAQYRLGACYEGVYGVEKDEKQSQHWFLLAALNGEEDAIEKVGIGKDYKIVDFEKAVAWLTSSAEKDNIEAIYALGVVYEQSGENQDLDKALAWYQKGVERQNEECLTRLGFTENKDYTQDTARFVFWYGLSNQGNAFAKMRLGDCYLYGTGTAQDNERAFLWYEQSANAGCSIASYNLGNYYYNHDKLVPKDDAKAVYFFDLAANENHVPAMMILASCYENAFGCEKDFNKAHYWYEKAASLRNYEAEKKLAKFKKNKDGNWTKKLF